MQRPSRRRVLSAASAAVLLATFGAAAVGHADAPVSNRSSLKQDLCYQIVTDRFNNGDTSNDNPAKSPGLYDSTKTNWKEYWGGDFAGIQAKLTYLKNMGVTSIWISPHTDNIDVPVSYSGVTNTGYHGYWTRDFKKTEEHFGSLTDFDNLIAAAHTAGIKVIMDWAPNHSSPASSTDATFADNGALYDNGTLVAKYGSDPNGVFHHNGGITNYDDRYQDQYLNMADLADLEQQNTTVNSLLKTDANYWMDRGVDGIRMDAVKHMTPGWQQSFADTVLNHKDTTLFGEWYLGSQTDATYDANVRFANTSGISVLDFYMNIAMRNAFAYGGSMSALDAAVTKTGTDYKYKENLVTFLDNHDMSRFLTANNNNSLLQQAIAFMMTLRGTPCLYYGTEQYLHNDTSGGGDPYNRPMMSSWSTTTTAYQEIAKLSALRQSNPALAYGTHQERWMNNDVYIYERKFGTDVVLTAINKGTSNYSITGLNTAMPAGTYSDQLTGLLGGSSITVSAGSGGNNPVSTFTLAAGNTAVWSYKAASEPSAPLIGSVGPTLTRTGNTITVEGRGFGSSGTLKVGGVTATTTSWTANRIIGTVPSGVTAGTASVTVTTGGGTSNGYDVTNETAAQVPVTFTVNNASPTSPGDNIYLTGSVAELGNWSTSKNIAIGPMNTPNYPNWFVTASVPACTTIQFKFEKITSGGVVTWENGSNHSYTTPCSGVGSTTVSWQY
ncbi:alpha-amylase family glycosyl hydrolase [Hamadaea tsunoensis]|uniref:alpha-amylase family glycosyl hydrolase n=1 Tax=Hamadaea tsunoensis TaxID=53368 RepID=UPI00041F56EF|nr:alpha-amylase family glycosyl hydrolase [Hamadaea tsunoensis]